MDFIFDPSLVLYLPLYQLDGASFTSNDAYGHLCTVNGALWTPKGRSFDGVDDYISSPYVQAYTLGGWVKQDNALASRIIVIPKSTTSWTDPFVELALGVKATGEFFADCNVGAVYKSAVSTEAFATNTWYYLATTYDKSNLILFVNGIQKAITTAAGDITRYTQSVLVGSRSPAPANPWNGTIGEVFIYSRVLTPVEIQHNYIATRWRYR